MKRVYETNFMFPPPPPPPPKSPLVLGIEKLERDNARLDKTVVELLAAAREHYREIDNLDRANQTLRRDLSNQRATITELREDKRLLGLKNDEQALTIRNLQRDLGRATDQIKYTLKMLDEEYRRTAPSYVIPFTARSEARYEICSQFTAYRVVVSPSHTYSQFVLDGSVATWSDERIAANVEDMVKHVAGDLRPKLTAEFKKARQEARDQRVYKPRRGYRADQVIIDDPHALWR